MDELNYKGILVFQGMNLGFLEGDLQIAFNENGVNDSKAILSTAYNVAPIWIKIASDSLKRAKEASRILRENLPENENDIKKLLLDELAASLLVFTACAITFDSIFDLFRPYVKLSEGTIKSWKNNRTKRSSKILTIIKYLYGIDNGTSKNLKLVLEHIFTYRDRAVHPSMKLERSIYREDIKRGVDWKFVRYNYNSSKQCLENTINIIGYFHLHQPKLEEVKLIIQNIIDALFEMEVIVKSTKTTI